MTASAILGPDGLPIGKTVLTREHAAATVGGVRSPWHDTVAKNLDPAKLARVIKDANTGRHDAYLILAEEMEERDTHYASVLGQRKRAISLIEPIVTGMEGDERIVEEVEKLIEAPVFADMIDDCLDGIAKGYSAVEVIWEHGEDLWKPKKYIHRDPRFFQFDKLTGTELRIKDDKIKEGREIPPWSMIVHRPRLKSGFPVRSGLARLVSWMFMLKAFTLQDWAAFLEVFGMPLRVGKYHGEASEKERATLLRAVRDLGHDAAAIIDQGMEIEFIEARGGQGNAVFGAMAEYLDKQVSKAVLGQTMTTDDGSSLSQAKIHEDVKIDIKKADARQLGTTINRDLIVPFVSFNFGPDASAPIVSWPVEDPEDIRTMSEALAKLVPMGLKVPMAAVRKKVGFAAPGEGEEVLVPPKETVRDPADESEDDETMKNERARACPHCGGSHLASGQGDLLDRLVEAGLDNWQADMQPMLDRITEIANEASGYEDFVQRLNTLNPDTAALAKTMAIQAMIARGEGDIGNG